MIGLHGARQLLEQRKIIRSVAAITSGLKRSFGDCGGWFAAEDGESAGGEVSIMVCMIRLGYHQYVICSKIGAQGIGSRVCKSDWVNDPSVDKAKDDADDQCNKRRKPTRHGIILPQEN